MVCSGLIPNVDAPAPEGEVPAIVVLPRTGEISPDDIDVRFTVPSDGWRSIKDPYGFPHRVNVRGDVTEILEGPAKGAQHFLNVGALERELETHGRIPLTAEELRHLVTHHAGWLLENLPLFGSQRGVTEQFSGQGIHGLFGIPEGVHGFCTSLFVCPSKGILEVNGYSSRYIGYSAICRKK
jgi:hypothetical protein